MGFEGVARPFRWLALVACFASCGPEDAAGEADAQPDLPVQPFSVQIGRLDAAHAFTPIASTDSVEIVVGFQGLIFFDLALLAPAEVPAEMSAEAAVRFDDPAQNFSFRTNHVEFRPFRGGRLSPAFRVPFGQDLALIAGQHIAIELVLTAPGWRGEASADFDIVDEDVCSPDGTGEDRCDDF
jgi:hypothetical protein